MHHKKACNYDGLHFLSVETARFQIHDCEKKVAQATQVTRDCLCSVQCQT